MEYLILAGLILLNGVFAMSEIAVVTAHKARLAKQAEAGDDAARRALVLAEDPTQFLSTIQIGITSIGLLNGIVGEAVLAAPLARRLSALGINEGSAHLAATAIVVIVVTYSSIVVGELVPKRLGQLNPDQVSRLVARPMQWLALGTRPFVMLLTVSTNAILRILRVREVDQAGVTQEEIQSMLEEGSEAGVIEPQQHDMVRNVFRMDDRKLGSLMIPRSDVVYIDIQASVEHNLQRMMESEYSRFPLCDGGLDNPLGIVHAKKALSMAAQGQTPDLRAIAEPAVYVPETLTGMGLLEHFRASGNPMAFVVDEYGDLQGLVTLQDMMEALTGEFTPHDLQHASAVQRADGSWLLDGSIAIPETKDRLGLKTVPEEDKGRYHTISGMLMVLMDRIPCAGEVADWEGWRFEVVDVDGRRIDKVLATRMPVEHD